jgi:hypothetical protein
VGIALWGGNPVPGTASTVGMRIGSTPRVSVSARMLLVPMVVPPLLDRSDDRGRRALIPSFAAQTAVGLFPGWAPVPTVGGVGSLDVVGGGGVGTPPPDPDFPDLTGLGGALGVRLGVVRESFTLPGVSMTGTYGLSSTVTLGDPGLRASDGFAAGTISDLGATLAVSQRIAAARVAAGVAADRYSTHARVGFTAGDGHAGEVHRTRVVTNRRSWFANAAWTFLVAHAVAEVGWQEVSEPTGLRPGVRVDPVGWWAGAALRLSI